MSILAIDTATQVSSVAVADEGRLLAELTMQGKLTHSETLLPHIEQVLKMAAVAKEDLTGIAISNGPGSFTGLRIGLAAAKAMSYVLNIPLVGVSTLQALAYQLPVPGVRLMCLLDAQKGNAYGGHVIEGCKVLLTTDILIGEIEGLEMGREYDPDLEVYIFGPKNIEKK